VYIATVPDSSLPGTLQPPLLPETMGLDIAGRASLAMSADPAAAAHDPTLLLAALEEIEVRRAAIEWLLEANLLGLCLA
jgi:hypothetical protein